MTQTPSGDAFVPRRGRRSGPSKPDWPQVGRRLLDASALETWRGRAPSFSAWLSNLAAEMGLKDASLWRYMSAVRGFEIIQRDLQAAGDRCPSVERFAHVGPEQIELVVKIRRFLPADQVIWLHRGLIQGTLRRDELRKAWDAAKALDGTVAPRADDDPLVLDDLATKSSRERLLKLGQSLPEGFFARFTGIFCGADEPVVCHEFTGLRIMSLGEHYAREPIADRVIVAQANATDLMSVHGLFFITADVEHQVLVRIQDARPFFDAVWAVKLNESKTLEALKAEPGVGVLTADSNRQMARVTRQADMSGDRGSRPEHHHLAGAIVLAVMRASARYS